MGHLHPDVPYRSKRRALAVLSLLAAVALPLPLALVQAGPPEPADAALAGLWESSPTLATVSALWLSPTGEAVWGSVMSVDGTYEVRGDQLLTRMSLPGGEDGGAESAGLIGTLTKSTWEREHPGGTERRERVGAPEEVTVRGVWRFLHPRVGRTAFERYGSEGDLRSRTQIGPGRSGTWARAGGSVRIRWDDASHSMLTVVGAELRASAGVFGEIAFTLRSPENWYSLALEPVVFSEGLTPSSDPEAVGLWESPSTSLGGIGSALWLDPSGRVWSAAVVLLDGTYEVREAQLILRLGGAQGEESIKTDLGQLTATTWRQEMEGEAVVRERVPPSAKATVQGVWRSRHYTGGIATERYQPDGAWQFRLPLGFAEIGTWSRKDDRIELRWTGDPPTALRLAGDKLLQTSDKEESPRALRRGKEDWYSLAGPLEPSLARQP